MLLKNLKLQHFRSYSKKNLSFHDGLTIISGPNTIGKTNILEAIFLIAAGKSFRADNDPEMISYKDEVAHVRCDLDKNGDKEKLEMFLTRGHLYGKKIASKKYLVNGVSRKMTDFVGRLKVCLFWPEDLELVTDSPSIRRKYLDFVLTQTDKEYLRLLRIYEKGLRFRNRLLEKIREGQAKREELIYWNNLVIQSGSYLTKKRSEFIEYINSMQDLLDSKSFFLTYNSSIISESRLDQYAEEEVQAGTTLVGPHRDDIRFQINKRDLSRFGSRGEQRLGILWLKLRELAFIKEKSVENPVLLLDDIFSEFDHHNRQVVFAHIGYQQTIITTTDMHLIDKKFIKDAQLINLD